MLEHYARHKQSDKDKIVAACEEVKRKKEPPKDHQIGYDGIFYISEPIPNLTFFVENAGSHLPTKASLNASLYTAAEGGTGQIRAESPTAPDSSQSLDMIAVSGKNRQQTAPSLNYLDCPSGGQGIASACPNSFILLHLEVFAIAFSIYFSILGKKLECSDGDNMPVSQGFLPEFALHVTTPLDRTLDPDFQHSGGDASFPSIATIPLYSFELDTDRTSTPKTERIHHD